MMEFSTLFKRQLGLVYQERIEDEKVYITGNGAIIPYLITNLCFLGLGTSQGVMSLPHDLKVTKSEIIGQNLLKAEDEGQPLWLALKKRVKDRFSKAYMISSIEDVNSVNWDSIIIAMTNSNIEPEIPKYECPIYAIATKSAAYIGADKVEFEDSKWNVLTPSLSAIAAAMAAQEALRRRELIKPSEFLTSNLEMKHVVQRNNIYDKCVEYSNKRLGIPFNVRVKLGGETVPTSFEPVYEDVKVYDGDIEKTERRINKNRVIIRCTFPEDSFLNRVVYNLLEVLDESNPQQCQFKDKLLFSPFLDTKLEDGRIMDTKLTIPDRLENKKVFFLGVGGLGSWVSTLFNLSNTSGCTLVVDDIDDRVEEHNLNRQILFGKESIGIPKAVAAKKALELLNGSNKVTALDFALDIGTANNIINKEFVTLEEYLEKKKNPKFVPGTSIPMDIIGEDLVLANEIKDCDLIISGPDNIRTRYIASLVGKLTNTPVVNAGGEIFEGKVDLFLPDGDCYVCRYGEQSKYEEKVVSCTGVLPTLSIVTTIATIAGMQSALSLAYLIHPESTKSLHHYFQYYGRYQMLATCQEGLCKHKVKPGCPQHLNLKDHENPFKFF